MALFSKTSPNPQEGGKTKVQKMTADTANKTIKNLQAEINALLQEEAKARTYSYSPGEEPDPPAYDFVATQDRLDTLRDQISVLRHAINQFNVNHRLEKLDGITLDEALRKMSVKHADKKRLFEMLQIPERDRVRSFGGRDADYVCRNFDKAAVKAAYDYVSNELMLIQQEINIANLTETLVVDF